MSWYQLTLEPDTVFYKQRPALPMKSWKKTGMSAGAHGKISPESGKICRTRKQRQPGDYLNPDKQFLAVCENVNTNELDFEFMLNTTRLQQAIPNALFTERTACLFNIWNRNCWKPKQKA